MKPTFRWMSALAATGLLLAACTGAAAPTVAPTAAPKPTDAPKPAATQVPPTPVLPRIEDVKRDASKPLGSPENPIIMALAPSSTSQELLVTGDAIAKEMNTYTGLTIKTIVPTSYAALIEAMGAGNAQIGWLAPLQYILAKQKGYADVAMATLRINAKDKQLHDHYGMQYLANKTSGFKQFFDDAASKSTADAATALKQFDGKIVCLTDPLSASGYVFPMGVLAKAGVKPSKVVETKAHPTTARTLYAGGQCDFGATYIDVRNEDAKLMQDLPDVMDKVQVIWRSDEFIPNDNVSLATKMDAATKAKLVDGFKKLAESETGKKSLKAVYSIDGLKTVDDTFYDELRSILAAGGIDVSQLVK
ncbi:MAG TPA: phosphate/phosphite/phosphonate ABC transporter substrate-binding protein [Thermoflexales bacterium]|nr:phosphate/phosphite/phosphonate ABC transporter substrate-binding protein [Thermoflexales bacterium]HQW34690.1 phosphate/phosphite/phosphonate ABC transporter substrate-binding protein [Thermoflexales bacterium]HQX75225.1 phosphate/phosphite/phosphonate ABC transporter substrate-binding protein [Thermoflexales bacterium]HQZ21997.1 phosphate/phosphite/phosphonate ABC transporter substrate-binding protein [Thermoflexales bacterium]HRA01009.1 phosphate/phosphite/phosphonate ABC transporter subs